MSLEIQNIVGTGRLGVELEISALFNDVSAHEVTYNPDNYHGLYLRLSEDGPLVTVYRSGKYIITGADSEIELRENKESFLRLMNDMGVVDHARDDSFSVNNIVCTADLGISLNLNSLVVALGFERTEYEPEQFPGLVYRPEEYPCVLLLFGSGKCVVTGAPTLKDAEDAFEHVRDLLEELM